MRNPRPTSRRPGRPRGNAPDQRERLLDAALRAYVAQGISATSLRDVAAEAGVTPALLGYYFGGKDALLQAVMDERLLPLVAGVGHGLQQAEDNAAALVAGLVHGLHAAVARYPWLPGLWVREVLSEGGALRELMLERIAPQVPQLLATRLAAIQARGGLNPDLDPRLLVVSLIGLTLFPLAAEPVWRRLFDAADIDHAALIKHTFALLDRGLEPEHAT